MRSPIRVLITDDEVEYAESLARVLRRRGILVEVAHDGAAAIEAFARQEFEAVVLDLRMPVMDGLATLEEIRKRDVLTPVLLLSGHADLGRVSEALKGGAEGFLLKPCAVETLVSAIEDAAERKAIVQDLASRGRPPTSDGTRR